jgi:hypothetical protein
VSEQTELDLDWPSGHAPDYYNKMLGKAVRVTVPVEFWTGDWHDGMRARIYIGTLCGHHEGGYCLQPQDRAQGVSPEHGRCFPVNGKMTIEVLPGRPEDY